MMIRSDLKGENAATGVLEPEVEQEIVEQQLVEHKVAEPFRYREKAIPAGGSSKTYTRSPYWLPVDEEC